LEGIQTVKGGNVFHFEVVLEFLVAEVEALGGHWIAALSRYFGFELLAVIRKK